MTIALLKGTLCATVGALHIQGHYLIHSSKTKNRTKQKKPQGVRHQDDTPLCQEAK